VPGAGALFLVAAAISSAAGTAVEPWRTICVVGLAGAFLSWCLVIPIGIFNRPRFLVVPYLRDKRRL
jgi:hypothetical protein